MKIGKNGRPPQYNLAYMSRFSYLSRLALAMTLALAAVMCAAANQPPGTVLVPCPENAPGGDACQPTRSALKEAKADFDKALKLQKSKKLDEAFPKFESAARLAPKNAQYITAREMARQQLVFDHIERGNQDVLQNRTVEAIAEFRNALLFDPDNSFAQQRLHDVVGSWAPRVHETPRVLRDSGELVVHPNSRRNDFQFRGDSRALLNQVAAVYGIKVNMDDSVQSKQVRFEVTDVDFYTAMDLACMVTHTFWTPTQGDEILVALDSPENHRLFDRMVMRTFYIPGADSPQAITDITNMLRSVLEIRSVTPQLQNRTIVVKAPQAIVDAATQLLESLYDSRPQVMLDVHVYEISHNFMRDMGLHIPNDFTLFNIPAGALAALGGQNIQQLINQLIAGGGINQANSQSLSALLAQLQNQQNSLFSTPVATFGNGLTLMGLTLGTASAALSLNDSTVESLEHAMLRVSQGNDTTFRMGTRYPILNASFAPVFNTPAIAGVIQNNSFQSPFPSFSYEDIGLSLKIKPYISEDSVVSMNMEMQLRTLLAQSLNGIPVIANREYKGTIALRDGEPAVVAGAVSHNEQRSLSGIPGLGDVPALNQIMASNSKETDDDELLIVVTPHVVSNPNHDKNTEVWLRR